MTFRRNSNHALPDELTIPQKADNIRLVINSHVKSCALEMFKTRIYFENEEQIYDFMKLKGPRSMMEWAYRLDVTGNKLRPIENLDEASKWHYWNKAKRLGLEKDETIKAAKGIYYMDYMAEKWVKE